MTDVLDLDEVMATPARPWRWHLAQTGPLDIMPVDVPDDATEADGHRAALTLRELILKHWEENGEQECILLEMPSTRSLFGVTASDTLPEHNAAGGHTRVIPRHVWPLVADPPDVPDGQMAMLP